MLIKDTELPARVKFFLQRADIMTVKQLCKQSKLLLYSLYGMGKKGVTEIERFLSSQGLSLQPSDFKKLYRDELREVNKRLIRTRKRIKELIPIVAETPTWALRDRIILNQLKGGVVLLKDEKKRLQRKLKELNAARH